MGVRVKAIGVISSCFVLLQNAGSCSYTVTIKTSCSSPAYTRDYISIAFGDAYGNQVLSDFLTKFHPQNENCAVSFFSFFFL